MSTHCPSLSHIAFVDGTNSVSTGGMSLSFVADGSLVSTISGCFLSIIADDNPLSIVFSCFLSFIAGSSFLFPISGFLSFFITSGDFLTIILSCFLSLVIGGSLWSTIFGGGFLSSMPLARSQALFWTSTPSCVHGFFCPLYNFLILFCPSYLYRLAVTQLY